jgi:ketosteroid isomerase-like protein
MASARSVRQDFSVRVLVVVALVACGSSPKSVERPPVANSPPAATNPELTPALEPLAWMLGDWHGDDGETEHTVAAGGTIYTVYFNREHGEPDSPSWGVRMIDDGDGESDTADGIRRWVQIATGEGLVTGSEASFEPDHVVYAASWDQLAVTLDLRRDGDTLSERVTLGTLEVPRRFTAAIDAAAPELEAADREFDAAAAARGVDGWVTAFALGGAMVRDHEWITGDAAIGAKVEKTLTTGHLRWAPIASRIHGDFGFTVGTAIWTANDATEPAWRGSYVTIWGKQDDGSWSVLLDTGRTAQPPK